MKQTARVLIGAMAVATLFGAQPVASVTSSVNFMLRGAEVNVAGVPTWAMMTGDEVSTHQGPATIEFVDGTRLTLLENTRAKVEMAGSAMILRLLSGDLRVGALPSKSRIQIFAQNGPAKVSAGSVVSSAGVVTPAAQTAAARFNANGKVVAPSASSK